MINQSAEKHAMSLLFREHLAELSWYKKVGENDGNTETTKFKNNRRTRPEANRS